MNTHVNGHFTPMTLAELRQSLLAVYVGNPHFSAAEQLEATHEAHASEDWHYLAAWLKGARLEDARRRHEAHLLALNTKPLALAVCHDQQAQLAELDALLQCRALNPYQKSTALLLIADPIFDVRSRVRMLGNAYFALLHNVGYQEVPNRYKGLLSN